MQIVAGSEQFDGERDPARPNLPRQTVVPDCCPARWLGRPAESQQGRDFVLQAENLEKSRRGLGGVSAGSRRGLGGVSSGSHRGSRRGLGGVSTGSHPGSQRGLGGVSAGSRQGLGGGPAGAWRGPGGLSPGISAGSRPGSWHGPCQVTGRTHSGSPHPLSSVLPGLRVFLNQVSGISKPGFDGVWLGLGCIQACP